MRSIFLLIFASALLLPPVSARAAGDSIVISTGRERGSYYYIGKRLATELAVAHELLARVVTSRGSIENLEQLGAPESPVSVTFSQADALTLHIDEHPDFADQFFVLGDVGRECAFLITGSNGPRDLDAFKQEGGEISVGDAGSGAAVTWKNLVRLEPGFAATKAIPVSTEEALIQLRDGSAFTRLRAAMIVQRPKRSSPALETVMADSKSFRVIPIRSKDLANAKGPDGREIYSFERIVAGGKQRRGHLEVDTLCTRGLMLGSKLKLTSEQRGQLSALMLEARDRIVMQDE